MVELRAAVAPESQTDKQFQRALITFTTEELRQRSAEHSFLWDNRLEQRHRRPELDVIRAPQDLKRTFAPGGQQESGAFEETRSENGMEPIFFDLLARRNAIAVCH
jgi:hypothetical protein